MTTFKSQLLGLILILGATITLDAQGDSVPFEKVFINDTAKEEVITTSANTEIIKHITSNLQYPQHLTEFKMSGTSLVRFRINEAGEIVSKNIITSMGAAFDKAVMNSVKNLKSVSPIYRNGVATNYAIVVPVRFQP